MRDLFAVANLLVVLRSLVLNRRLILIRECKLPTTNAIRTTALTASAAASMDCQMHRQDCRCSCDIAAVTAVTKQLQQRSSTDGTARIQSAVI